MPTDRLLPNKRIRRVLLAIQEVMGRNGLNATLKLAGLDRFINALPPDDADAEVRASEYAALIQAVETQFGSNARG
ncbi:MAG: 4-vinyl reductase, partial [Chloroflexota bacterium]